MGPRPSFRARATVADRKSTRLNSSHPTISYAVFCLKKISQAEKSAVGKPIMYYSRKRMLNLYVSKQSVIFRYDSVYSLNFFYKKEDPAGLYTVPIQRNLQV